MFVGVMTDTRFEYGQLWYRAVDVVVVVAVVIVLEEIVITDAILSLLCCIPAGKIDMLSPFLFSFSFSKLYVTIRIHRRLMLHSYGVYSQ